MSKLSSRNSNAFCCVPVNMVMVCVINLILVYVINLVMVWVMTGTLVEALLCWAPSRAAANHGTPSSDGAAERAFSLGPCG